MTRYLLPLPLRETGLVNSLLTSLSFLTSPVVEIIVGEGDQQKVLTAHQTLLLESPFLSEFVGKFESSGPVILTVGSSLYTSNRAY
jgi:hypothetical protein